MSKALLKFWRNCAIDGERTSVTWQQILNCFTSGLATEGLLSGYIKPSVTEAVFVAAEEMAPSPADKKRVVVQVVVIPFLLSPPVEHGASRAPEGVIPLCIPAELSLEGVLTPSPELVPWIPRQHLTPNERGLPTFSSVAAVDRWVSLNDSLQTESWDRYCSWALRCLNETGGEGLMELENEGWFRSPGLIFPIQAVQAVGNILRLYDRLMTHDSPSPLLDELMRGAAVGGTVDGMRTSLTPEQQIGIASTHVGQMSSEFGLAPSQRQALHHLLALPAGKMLAINGPPGTGKTTFLQSVAATMFVQAAVAGGMPPVLVACSTNNQAVTNIVDSFARTGIERWIPGINTLALYCPSQSRSGSQEVAERGYLTLQKFESLVGDLDFVLESENLWLSRFASEAGKALSAVSLDYACRYYQDKVVKLTREIASGCAALAELRKIYHDLSCDGEDVLGGLDAKISTTLSELERARQGKTFVLEAQKAWEQRVLDLPIWVKLLEDLRVPFFSNKARLHYLQTFRSFLDEWSREALWEHRGRPADSFAATKAMLSRLERQKTEELNRLEALRESVVRSYVAAQSWLGRPPSRDAILGDENVYLSRGDTTKRLEAFEAALRYWEARWLLEMKSLAMGGHDFSREWHPPKRLAMWRRIAKLFPMIVSTFHSAPSHFSGREGSYRQPLFDLIDLLVVDEAGQCSPEIAAPTFSLAKKALVVGDLLQIEPVQTLPYGVARSNWRRHMGEKIDYEAFVDSGGAPTHGGSVMRIAQNRSPYESEPGERGMLLREHRRCVPYVIEFCNRLAYRGGLIPLRPAQKGPLYPPVSYSHVEGVCRKRGGSRVNEVEAEAIALWIERQKDRIEQFYGRSLADKDFPPLAVVTPFAPQAQLIKRKLTQKRLPRITVGTVHALQGAERNIVIFSPVYDLASADGRLFFDNGPNMLNVAVSRAKDAFIVIGDISIFNPSKNTPSGLMGRWLRERGQEVL